MFLSVWILFLGNNYLVICVLPLLWQVKKNFGRFQLEAPRAYMCKHILGLCHEGVNRNLMKVNKADRVIFVYVDMMILL